MNLWLSSATPSAELAGPGVVALLLILGVLKCLKMARRPATNGISVMALAMALLAVAAITSGTSVAAWYPETFDVASLTGVILVVVCGLAALLLGAVGLATHDPKLHTQGHAQAFWGMGLAVLFTGFGSFGLILRAVRQAPAAVVLTNVDRPGWGYTTHLPEHDWKDWPDHGNALADFAALRDHEGILVLTVDLGQKAPDLELLATGLMSQINIEYPSDEGWTSKPWHNNWGDGLEITGLQSTDGNAFNYIVRVVAEGRLSHLHVGWAGKTQGNLALVRSALDSINLSPPEAPLPVQAEKKIHACGMVCNKMGIKLYQEDQFKEALPWFKRAVEQAPDDANILSNVVDSYMKIGMHKEGLAYLIPRLGAFPQSATLHLDHAYLLSNTGDHAAGEAAFLKALATGLKDEDKVLVWLQHLGEKEQDDLAEDAAEAWMKKRPDVNSRRWHAELVISAGDEKRGLKLYEELCTEYPDDRRAGYDYGEALNRAGDHAGAAAIAEKALADGKHYPRALMILGWSQMGRKWYREAKQTFEKVAAKDGDNETVQDALREASAMLGQGNNSDIKTPIEVVAMPDSVRQALQAHPPEKGHGSDQPYAWLLTANGYYFEPDKPARRTVHRRARIHTTEGANALSSIEIAFDPLGERIFINRVSVLDESGKTVASAAEDAYVMDLNTGSANHRKKLHFQIPGLRPGCTMEYEVSIEDRSKAGTFTFQRLLFGNSAADIVFVTGAVDKVQVAAFRTEGLQIVREKDLAAWMGFNLPYDRGEPMSGQYEDRVPGVYLGGKEGTWAEIGEKFLKDIEDRLKPEDAVTQVATKLTEGLKTPREKVAVLTRHVQKLISYTAIEFGSRARRPNQAGQTLQQQYGDCKDQALLLHQLLKAAAVESHLALVSSEWRTEAGLPTLDQFNHMVVHVPALGEGWLIDPTNKSLPAHLWPADYLWHSHALILQPGKTRLAPAVATPAAESCVVTSRRSIRPEGDAWHVDETLTLHGYYAAWMRGVFTGLDAAARLRKVQGMMEKNGHVSVHQFSFEALEDLAEPATLVMSYDVSGRLHGEEGLMRAALPALWENEYLVTTFVKERQTDLHVRYPFRFQSDVTVLHTPHLTPSSAKALARSGGGPFTQWKIDASAEADSAKVHFEFTGFPGKHPAASYAAWHDAWHSALKCWDQPIVWKP